MDCCSSHGKQEYKNNNLDNVGEKEEKKISWMTIIIIILIILLIVSVFY